MPVSHASLPPAAILPALPIDDPTLIFGLALLVFLVAPLLLERVNFPGIVGIILVGTLVGPNGLGVLERGEPIVLLGEVGVIYLMFLAGLEIDRREFAVNRRRSVVFGLLSFVVPQAIGMAVGVVALGMSVPVAALFASVFASHTLLAYPIVSRLGITNNRAVTTTIGGTIITDTLALLVLAVVVGATAGALGAAFWLQLLVGLVAFFVGSWLFIPLIGRWFFRSVSEESYFEYLFVMVLVFACAYAAELVGVEAIIGAFLAGLAINPLIPKAGVLMNRIEFVGTALFVPFFLFSVGMLVDPAAALEGTRTLIVTAALLAMVLVTKYAAAWATGRRYGYTTAEITTMFGLSVGQAAAALAVTLVGFEIGLFDQAIVNAVVLMILAISIASPAIVDRSGRDIAAAKAERGYEPTATPERILIPLSVDDEYREGLLDLALLVRDRRADEPIYTITVVQPADAGGVDAEIATAEATGAATQAYAAGAEVALDSQTRVNYNVASGIADAALENRISVLLLGWDGARSRRQHTFGSVIDRVLRQTRQLVVVAGIETPLNATRRLVVVLPPGIENNDGFYRAVHAVKSIADGLDATIDGYAVDGDPARYEHLFELVDPEVSAAFAAVDGWQSLRTALREDVQSDDLLVCLSARRGRLGWHPELQTLPSDLAAIAPGSFLVVYPRSGKRADDRRFLTIRD
ncbi:cation:proton antiporter [Haloferacaceae archaeon DSL9]